MEELEKHLIFTKIFDRFKELVRFTKEIRNNIESCEVCVEVIAKLSRNLKQRGLKSCKLNI